MSPSPHSCSPSSVYHSRPSLLASPASIIEPTTPPFTVSPLRPLTRSALTSRQQGEDYVERVVGWKITFESPMSGGTNDLPPHCHSNMATSVMGNKSAVQGSSWKQSGTVVKTVQPGCARFTRTGSCAYGDQCRYSHDATPNAVERGRSRSQGTASHEVKKAIDHCLRKTRICDFFEEGKCDFGPECRFAHIAGDDAFQIIRKANASKDCPFELFLGQCATKGRGCQFRHTPIERVITTSPNEGRTESLLTTNQARGFEAEYTVARDRFRFRSGLRSRSSGMAGSDEMNEDFAKELNDLIDLRKGLKDVHVSRE